MNFVRSNNGGNYANNYRTSRMQDMSITVHELSIVAIFVPGKTRRKAKATATAKATKAGTNKTEGRPPAKFRFGEKKRTKERDSEERILIKQ